MIALFAIGALAVLVAAFVVTIACLVWGVLVDRTTQRRPTAAAYTPNKPGGFDDNDRDRIEANFCNASYQQLADYADKAISKFVCTSETYTVFLDTEERVCYLTSKRNQHDVELGAILPRVRDVEAIQTNELTSQFITHSRGMLAEAVALALEGHLDEANGEVDVARQLILDRKAEVARTWTIVASGLCALAFVLFGAIVWILRCPMRHLMGMDFPDIVVWATLGAIGGFTSLALRAQTLHIDASSGSRLVVIESITRVLVGAFFGSLAPYATQAILIPLLKDSTEDSIRTCLPIVAATLGFSEKLFRGIVKRIEDT